MSPQINDVGASGKINFCLYGDPGVGKTKLIGSGGKDFKILIIRPPVDHVDSILGSGCKEMIVHDWSEMTEGLEYLRHEGDKWDWVWLDSISLWQDVGLDDIWQATLERTPARGRFGLDKGEYGINMQRLEQFIRHAVGAKLFNFGVTAHAFWATRQAQDSPESSFDQLMPWVQGKMMAEKICGYMNVVGYMEVKTRGTSGREYRVIRTRKSPRYFAKDQFDAWLPSGDIINPTLPEIVAAIEAKRQPARRRTRRTTTRRRAA